MKRNYYNNFQNIPGQRQAIYDKALLDPRWRKKRKLILERDGYRCMICKSDTQLEVHHRQYHFLLPLNVFKNPWEYENHLLITLCEKCHQTGHQLYKVPVKYID